MVQTPKGVVDEDLEMDSVELASIDEIEALAARFSRIKESVFNDNILQGYYDAIKEEIGLHLNQDGKGDYGTPRNNKNAESGPFMF